MIRTVNVIISITFILVLLPFVCPAEERDIILATVGSEKITQNDIDKMIASMPPQVRKRYGKIGVEKLLKSIIQTKLFAYGARQMKLDEQPEVKRKIKDMMEGLLAGEYLKYIREGVTTTIEEDDIKKYYEQNLDKFKLPERVKARHIAVEKKEEAQEVLAILKEGADFAETARKKSIDPNGEKGGDLGWIIRGRTAPELEEALFKVKKGEISDIIQTKTGYHIIKVEDHKAAGIIKLENVKVKIKTMLQQKRLGEVMLEMSDKLEKEVGVQIFSERLKGNKDTSGTEGKGK